MNHSNLPPVPDFRLADFLRDHMRKIMDFYYPISINEEFGGYYNGFLDDGTIYDRHTQHLVSTTRFIFVYSTAAMIFGREDFLRAAEHGLKYLNDKQHDADYAGYFWVMQDDKPQDDNKLCYGHAFVLLAYAAAAKAGIRGAKEKIEATYQLLEQRFWREKDQLYVDEVSRDWSTVLPYRGQNANMHMCEAMIASYEATGEAKFLHRAATLARRVCGDLSERAGGVVWEHYREDWTVDWDYNKDDPEHLFKPYGFQPGHMTEWAKLLLRLDYHQPQDWLLPKAEHLYAHALAKSADLAHGGLHYGYTPDGSLCHLDKYHWVHCETVAAAAALAARTGATRYWQDYDRLWTYSWHKMIDHQFGGWFRIVSPDGRKYSQEKSPPGKTDYHPLGACYDILRAIGAEK